MSPTLRLTPPQWSVFTSPTRFRVLVAGRRFGKTYLAAPELLRMAWGPGREAWYVAPTRHQAKDDIWRPLKRLAAPWISGKPNETELSIDLVCGGRVALRSAENYDSLRGGGLDGLILDEYADIASEAWTEALRPKLSDRLGRALFIGTPEGFNHFHELWDAARSGRPDWAAWQYTTAQGGNVPLSEIDAAKHDLAEKTFRQEYEASFENLGSGLTYYAFDRAHNCAAVGFDPRLPLCWSLDFNVNPMCAVLAQIDGDSVRVLDEIILPDSNTHEACAEFMARADRLRGSMKADWREPVVDVKVYGDATGQNRQHAGVSDWQIIREFAGRVADRFRFTWRVRTSNPEIKDRVAAVNARLKSHAGDRRLIVDPKCRELVTDLEQVEWKPDAAGNATGKLNGANPKRTHVSDALGYLIEREFGLLVVGGARSINLGL